jgi:hypothetical protein
MSKHLLLLAIILSAPGGLYAGHEADSDTVLVVKNAEGKETKFTTSEWAKLPRQKISAKDPHSGATFDYEGVLLPELLRAAGVTFGKDLKGPRLAAYVLAEAKDGYRVVYSIGEIDPDTGNIQILVVDKKNGATLPAAEGPFRFVIPQDKRAARWIRQVNGITLHQLPAPTAKK